MADAALEIAVLTLAGPLGPYVVAATERGVVAAGWAIDRGRPARRLRRRLGAVEVVRRRSGGGRPGGGPARPQAMLAGEPARIRRRSRSTSRTARASTRSCSARCGPSAGARPPVTARSPGSVGAPRASRAVGGALGRNPISLVIPCHRVIAADGTLGGYGGDGWIDRDQQLSRKRRCCCGKASRSFAAPE